MKKITVSPRNLLTVTEEGCDLETFMCDGTFCWSYCGSFRRDKRKEPVEKNELFRPPTHRGNSRLTRSHEVFDRPHNEDGRVVRGQIPTCQGYGVKIVALSPSINRQRCGKDWGPQCLLLPSHCPCRLKGEEPSCGGRTEEDWVIG